MGRAAVSLSRMNLSNPSVSPGLAALRCYAGLRAMGVSVPVALAIAKAYLPTSGRLSLPAPSAMGTYDRVSMRSGLMSGLN